MVGDLLALEQFIKQRGVVAAQLPGDRRAHAEIGQTGSDIDGLAADIDLHPHGAVDRADAADRRLRWFDPAPD